MSYYPKCQSKSTTKRQKLFYDGVSQENRRKKHMISLKFNGCVFEIKTDGDVSKKNQTF